MYSDDEEDYGLQYSEDSTSEPDVDLENQYYQSKIIKQDNPAAALTSFQKVIELQGDNKGEWGFKALKQMIKINFQLKNYEETLNKYKDLLSYIKYAVTKNQGEKSINSILDYTSTSKNMELLQEFYEITLQALKHAKNDRLWFKTNTKLGKVYLERGEFNKVHSIIKQLKQSCQNDSGEEDLHKGTQLLEIYALEIQIHTELKNNKQLKQLYERALKVRSAIPHPLIMGTIRECGGKMHLRANEYEKAYTDFFEAFKNYDESGSYRRIASLKYLILTSMLMESTINPVDSQEAKPYKKDPEVQALCKLITAYQSNNKKDFERLFKESEDTLMSDPFMRDHISGLLNNIRTQVLLNLIKPYRLIKLHYITQELDIPEEDVKDLLISCILNGTINAKIDEINQILIKIMPEQSNSLYGAAEKLVNNISGIYQVIANCIM